MQITEIIVSTDIPGDLDRDVDRSDAALFMQSFGTSSGAVWTTGDFNADARMSLADLAQLQAHLGTSPPLSPLAQVPEPPAAALAALALALIAFRTRSTW